MNRSVFFAIPLLFVAGVASATPLIAGPAANAAAGAVAGSSSSSSSGSFAGGGGGGSGGSARGGNSDYVGAALGQAPLGVSGCLASTRIFFGLVETSWTAEDCLAMEAAKVAIQAGDIDLAREMIGKALGE